MGLSDSGRWVHFVEMSKVAAALIYIYLPIVERCGGDGVRVEKRWGAGAGVGAGVVKESGVGWGRGREGGREATIARHRRHCYSSYSLHWRVAIRS